MDEQRAPEAQGKRGSQSVQSEPDASGALSLLMEGLSGAERALLQERLWALLARQVARFTQGDATSLPVERAETLYESACFTLRCWLDAERLPPRALLRGDLDDALRAGWTLLEGRVREAKTRYAEALRGAPPYASRALRDTLRGIAPFFARYDWRLAAQEIPAEIDYPLCHPVPEAYRGVQYVGEYLRRLLIEELLLARASAPRAEALLRRYYGEIEEPLVNLYEPVAACAIGLALAGQDPRALTITPEDAAALTARLNGLAAEEEQVGSVAATLRAAAETAADALALPMGEDRLYLAEWAESLWPRARASLRGGTMENGALDGDAAGSDALRGVFAF